MDLIKHTFPSRKVVRVHSNADEQGTRAPRDTEEAESRSVWDRLMMFHAMEHVPKCMTLFGAWQNCIKAPIEHKHTHTCRTIHNSDTNKRVNTHEQVLSMTVIRMNLCTCA